MVTSTPRNTSARHRGIAMLLVIIALGAATVMTTGYLLSRRNSGAIGANAADSVTTRWASRAAAEQALAIMQTRADWRTQAMDGRLFENMPFGEATASAVITDLDGNSITGDENAVVLTAIAAIRTISSATQWIVNVTPAPTIENTLTPSLDEFAIYTVSSLTAEAGSTIAVWDKSPYSMLRPPLNIGTSAPLMDAMNVSNSATLVNTIAHVPPDAYSSLITYIEGSSLYAGTNILQTKIPVASAAYTFADSLPQYTVHPNDTRGPTNITLAPGSYNATTIKDGAVVTLDATLGRYFAFDNLKLDRDATLNILGDVVLEIADDLEVRNRSAVALASSDSSLTLYIGDDLIVNDSTIGVDPSYAADPFRDASQIDQYNSATDLQIFSQLPSLADAQASGSQQYRLDNSSVVVALVHAPTADMEIRNNSDLIGRVSSGTLMLASSSTILYDSALNPMFGITNPDGPLYTVNGTIRTEIKTALESYDPATGFELLTTYVESSTGDLETKLLDETAMFYDSDNLTPRFSHTAWTDTWPIELFAYESRTITPVDTIDGVLIQPTFDISDLLVEPMVTTQTTTGGTGGTGGGGSRSTMTFVEETDPLEF